MALPRSTAAVLIVAGIMMTGGGAVASDQTVIQMNKQFNPGSLVVKRGQTITFENHDPFAHNVYSITPGVEFDLKTQPPGKSSDVTFSKAGEVTVQCAIHPTMKMKVTVTE
jgi:plastocyanin